MTNRDIGIITNTASQFLLACDLIRAYTVNRPNQQHLIFHTNNIENIYTHFVPILPIVECKFFYGNLIVFDIPGLNIAIDSINVENILLYLTDNIWERYNTNMYEDMKILFNHNKLKVCTSDKKQFQDYYHCWGRKPDAVCEDIDYEKFSEIL